MTPPRPDRAPTHEPTAEERTVSDQVRAAAADVATRARVVRVVGDAIGPVADAL